MRRDHSVRACASVGPGADLRHNVSDETIVIGYHDCLGLSSKKCENRDDPPQICSPFEPGHAMTGSW